MPDVVIATRKRDFKDSLGRALGRKSRSWTVASSASTLLELLETLPETRVAIIDLDLPGLSVQRLVEMKLKARSEPYYILAFDRLSDFARIRDLPLNMFGASLRLCPAYPLSKRFFDTVVSYLDPDGHDERILHAFYDGNAREFSVVFRNGTVYRFPRKLLPEDDGSNVASVSVGSGGEAFIVELRSRRRIEVPSDLVLYHLEPQYPYYKERDEQKKLEADVATRIGKRVRALRRQKGLTTYRLAQLSGIQRPNISRMEAGKHVPSVDTLERLARALEVQVAELLGN